jgi:hypothetical protein
VVDIQLNTAVQFTYKFIHFVAGMEYIVLVEKTEPSSVNPDPAGIGTLNVSCWNWDFKCIGTMGLPTTFQLGCISILFVIKRYR